MKNRYKLKKVTIVITTYDRYSYLERLLTYYKEYPIETNIIVCDSSSQAFPESGGLKGLLQQKNVTWLRFDSTVFICEKIAKGLSQVATEYSVLCADDDFIVPNGLVSAVNFLDCDDSYSCAHGRYFFFSNEGKINFNPNYIESKSIASISSPDRVKALFENYGCYPFYAVHRNQQHQEIWRLTNQFVDEWGLPEIVSSYLSLIMGKMKKISTCYGFRTANEFSWVTPEAHQRMFSQKRIGLAVEALSTKLLQTSSLNKQESRQLIEEILRGHTCSKEQNTSRFKIFRFFIKVKTAICYRAMKIIWQLDRCPFRLIFAEKKFAKEIIKFFNLDDKEIIETRKKYA